jgi:2'-5' RNA ligase
MRPPDSGAPADTERLFIALTLPEPVRSALAVLPRHLNGVTWSPAEQWHLTLRFLGDVGAAQKERAIEKLSGVSVEPFILPVEQVGTFPPGRPPRVLWVGVGSGHPRLFQLRQKIDDAVLAAGVDLDVRSFHPHVTLGRCTDHADAAVAQWLHSHRDFSAPPFRVESFDLFRSELRLGGAVHTLVQRFQLA